MPGKVSLHSGLLPGNTEALCQHFSPIKNIVYHADLAGPKHIHTTTYNRLYMQYLERKSLPSAYMIITTTETNGRMGDAGYCSVVYGATPIPMNPQGQQKRAVTAAWLQPWNLTGR